jgi:peptidoglycan/xylan/chitin deacetylase (PgdA/CDA1 family)
MYHRIGDVPVDPRGTAVSPANFGQHLDYLRETCRPMPLMELAWAIKAGKVPNRAVVVTFDDGYASNWTCAYPLLKEAGIPATVFVVAGEVGSRQGFWWDELESVLLLTKDLPEYLEISIDQQEYSWPVALPAELEAAYGDLRRLLGQLQIEKRRCVVRELRAWANLPPSSFVHDRPMDRAELEQLVGNGLVTLGAHTMTHCRLANLSTTEQWVEILDSKQRLEATIGQPVLAFAYPYGQATDFGDDTVRAVKAAGFEVACTGIPGLLKGRDDLFQLHRCEIGNWNLKAFERHVEWWFAQ